jgi:hypothetical protein
MSEQLLKEGEAVLALKAQLGSEQALVRSLREQLLSKVRMRWGDGRRGR